MKDKAIKAIDKLANKFIKEYEPLDNASCQIGGVRFYRNGNYVAFGNELEGEKLEITRYRRGDVAVTSSLDNDLPTWKDLLEFVDNLDKKLVSALESREQGMMAEKKERVAELRAEIEKLETTD